MAVSACPGPSASARVGVLGGTFDPVHNAHLKMAQLFTERLALTEVRFVPAGDPWQKPALSTPPEARVAMLRAALEGFPLQRGAQHRHARFGRCGQCRLLPRISGRHEPNLREG